MSTLSSLTAAKGRPFKFNFWLISMALIAGLILSILSWLELCVEHCSANQDYRLFGLPFAIIGMFFFSLLLFLHTLSWYYPSLLKLVGWLIGCALGAEIVFILVQKYQIGHWCPVCLSIAASVAIAALVLLTGYLKNFKVTIQHRNRGDIMQKVNQGFISLCFIMLGFILAYVGIGKPNAAEAAVNDIKERIAFGAKNAPVEVYFITDWFCPSCKKIEPLIEKLYPKIRPKVTFYFIDYPIHRKSLNFTPYNLAFLANDKGHYFKARQALNELSDKVEAPNDEEIAQAAHQEGINFKELPYLDVRAGIDFFDKISAKYDIQATPTIIIVNIKNNKFIKMEGRDEISESKILKGIETVQSS
jgi:thiol-disulfide isomerase/thioredoxin